MKKVIIRALALAMLVLGMASCQSPVLDQDSEKVSLAKIHHTPASIGDVIHTDFVTYVADPFFGRDGCVSGPGICFRADDPWSWNNSWRDNGFIYGQSTPTNEHLSEEQLEQGLGSMFVALSDTKMLIIPSKIIGDDSSGFRVVTNTNLPSSVSELYGFELVEVIEGEYEINYTNYPEFGEVLVDIRTY